MINPLIQQTVRTNEGLMSEPIPPGYRGWWRIIDTSQWMNDYLDQLGPALLSLTGHGDRLRMLCLLAYVNCTPSKTGVSFTWEGAWEYDQMSGSGRVTLSKDGRLKGVIRIKDGDSSTFVACAPRSRPSPSRRRGGTETSGGGAGEAQGTRTQERRGALGTQQVGLEVPRGTRALRGRSQEAAIGAYRAWLKRKARKK